MGGRETIIERKTREYDNELFETFASNDFKYRNYTNTRYFKLSPHRFVIAKILLIIQFFYIEKIRILFGDECLSRISLLVEQTIGKYPAKKTKNFFILRMKNLAHMAKETWMIFITYRKVVKHGQAVYRDKNINMRPGG